MALHDKVMRLREKRLAGGQVSAVPSALQGVSKSKIRKVLDRLHLGHSNDLVDCVFALMDNKTPSWFTKAPADASFSDGATTAHLACHIGILQRGSGKLDREGRDYWIKPLRELGGIEPVTLYDGKFISGHPIAKSSGSAYRLAPDFKSVLLAKDAQWPRMLTRWASEDAARARREFQATAAAAARASVDTSHSNLIEASIKIYAARFLPGYVVIYVDDGDGDRISVAHRKKLAEAGVTLTLGDAKPDVLLWHSKADELWVIEAVTSDGEVDQHKVDQLRTLAGRCHKPGINFTTTYRTWKEAAARQRAHQNIAIDTYIWIQEDPAKQFLVKSFHGK